MKKYFIAIAVTLLAIAGIVGCSTKGEGNKAEGGGKQTEKNLTTEAKNDNKEEAKSEQKKDNEIFLFHRHMMLRTEVDDSQMTASDTDEFDYERCYTLENGTELYIAFFADKVGVIFDEDKEGIGKNLGSYEKIENIKDITVGPYRAVQYERTHDNFRTKETRIIIDADGMVVNFLCGVRDAKSEEDFEFSQKILEKQLGNVEITAVRQEQDGKYAQSIYSLAGKYLGKFSWELPPSSYIISNPNYASTTKESGIKHEFEITDTRIEKNLEREISSLSTSPQTITINGVDVSQYVEREYSYGGASRVYYYLLEKEGTTVILKNSYKLRDEDNEEEKAEIEAYEKAFVDSIQIELA